MKLNFETTEFAIEQRKEFLVNNNIGICDIVASCERDKIDASDLGMKNIKLRDLIHYLTIHTKVDTLLLTGGNSKNGPEYHLRRQLKSLKIDFTIVSPETPKIHTFIVSHSRKIKVISLTAPSGAANRAVGSNPLYKQLKQQNPNFNTFDFRVLQYKKYF